jgi:hypothetical protein
MATQVDDKAHPRVPLNRERILQTKVTLADEGGVESLSMRRLAHALGVVPMALTGTSPTRRRCWTAWSTSVVSEIDPPVAKTDWKTAVRQRVLSPLVERFSTTRGPLGSSRPGRTPLRR